tara:strand:+ start:681 stop:1004 length:324 start_codon:yes stop_codon:yes gene_type:complete
MMNDFLDNLAANLHHKSQPKMKLTKSQLEQFKANYACLIVDGMDMKTLEQFAIESVEQNIKDWNEEEIKEEILDYYGEETLNDLMPSTEDIGALETNTPQYGMGVGK